LLQETIYSLMFDQDAVVMQEDTTQGDSTNHIRIIEGVRPWENVRFAGEDLKKGTKIVAAGERIRAGQIALAGACGISHVPVGVMPKVALIATGNELVEPGQGLANGQIYESNRTTIAQLVEQAGGTPVTYPIVPDSLDRTVEALSTAFQECDVVVTSGAVSVGDHDLIKPALAQMGAELDFWKVAIRPGKPFVYGIQSGKAFFGLPGNPVSSFVTFLMLVRPALLRLQGARDLSLPTAMATLEEEFTNGSDRRHFVRVRMRHDGLVRSSGLQGSHVLTSLSQANALMDVPPRTRWEAGRKVKIMLLEA
jgi:molybdopterin molybdotransferase